MSKETDTISSQYSHNVFRDVYPIIDQRIDLLHTNALELASSDRPIMTANKYFWECNMEKYHLNFVNII